MPDSPQRSTPEEPKVRFEATLHAAVPDVDIAAMFARVADLDIDRIPDPEGGLRVLVTPADCVSLLEQGFEVRLLQALPLKPLDPRLVADDDEVRLWFEERARDVGGQGPA
jgi:hypothetical protein